MDIWNTFVSELLERPEGPFAFRFVLQPLMSTLLAVRDGRKDARNGHTPYFWKIAHSDGQGRRDAVGEGLKATAKIMLIGVLIDVVYQYKALGGFVRPLEAVVIAFVLGFIPYLLMRGPAARIFGKLQRPQPPDAG